MGSEISGLLLAVMFVVSLLAALGAAAAVFGADTRTPPGDDHGSPLRSDWT